MNGTQLSIIAGAGSALLLLGAFGFQAIGYAPCELCVLQRWPHAVAVVIALLILWTGRVQPLAILGALAAGCTAGIAIYHSGVELDWWAGPSHCSGGVGSLTGMSAQELLTQLQGAPVVRCDEVAWSFLGLSMAAWNALLSAVLAIIWVVASRKR